MSESEIRDGLMKALYRRIGVADSWSGVAATATFEVARADAVGRCAAEGTLTYVLPQGTALTHDSDILIDFQRPNAAVRGYVAIEIKHTSAVTDQFKCRAFDMLHLKKDFGPALCGVLLFARAGQGVGFDRAKAISYPFDEFVGVDLLKTPPESWWDEILRVVERRLDGH